MKTREILIIGLFVLGQWSCSDDDFDDASITTLNGTWKVASFEDATTGKVEHKTQENSWGYDIVVSFDDTTDPKIFSGTVTTNSVTGEFDYVGTRQFKLLRYGSTMIGQPAWADKFGSAVLGENVTFKINNKQLRIYYDNHTKSVTLVRE